MRKLLLIAMLAVSTMAWAHGAKKMDNQTRSDAGTDWYQAKLNPQIDQFVRLNKPEVIQSPSVAFSENKPVSFETPGSMAARQGGSDWYDQKVKIAAEVNRSDLEALKNAPELEKNSRLQTH